MIKSSILLFLFLVALNNILLAQASTNVPVALSANSGAMVARQPDSRGWTDPALNHNKLIQQKNGDGVYKMIGTYKVIGNCFLFGEHLKGDMFAPEAKAYNIYLSYNTYSQEVEFYSTSNPDHSLVKEPGAVDSFILQQNLDAGITQNLKFIYGASLGSKDKSYYLEVCKGERFSIYKRYKSDLGYSTTNLSESDLRQFDLQVEYYYRDANSKELKKIKPNSVSVIKEFKDVKDLSKIVLPDDFTSDPEAALCKAIGILNSTAKSF